jgi:pimeloyl-ACP methyl ester carboxylesterase
MKAIKNLLIAAVALPLMTAHVAIGQTVGSLNAANAMNAQEGKGKYAQVNGLKMYYEIHGVGKPLLLLHGAFGTVEGWGAFTPTLAKGRQVIVVELQGHGRTGDIDRPLAFTTMAEDVAQLLKQLSLKDVDVFGYSMGGDVALALAMKYPELVRKLAVLGSGTGSTKDTYDPETYKQFKSITPENFNFPVMKDPYTKVAPDPSKWPVLVSKIVKMDDNFKGFPAKDVKSIKAQTLIMMGDRDAVRVEHAVEMYRMIPNSQLAIFPAGDHFLPFAAPDKVLATLASFLEAPGLTKEEGHR